jgi:hypothetical protein
MSALVNFTGTPHSPRNALYSLIKLNPPTFSLNVSKYKKRQSLWL